jgi:hypothetical protein
MNSSIYQIKTPNESLADSGMSWKQSISKRRKSRGIRLSRQKPWKMRIYE